MEKIKLKHAILEALYIREIKPGLNTQGELRDHKLIIKVKPCLLIYRVIDPKTVSITSVTIINTLSFRTISEDDGYRNI